jgi:methionyl-tRNA formyltransferase
MNKIKVVFLGSRPLGFYALQKLREIDSIEIVGCVVKKPLENAWWKDDPYYIAKGNVLKHEDLHTINFDFGVSINYWRIIESELIIKPELGFINIHHSYMLSLRGRDMATHAILGARKNNRWYHGTTLHYTDDGLDTGPVIATESCPLTEEDTAWSLFNKTEILAKEMLNIWLPRILISRPPVSTPELMQPLNLRSSETLKKIENIFSDPIRTYDIVRAYDFNGYYESASTRINDRIVHLTTDIHRGGNIVLEIDSNKRVYECFER